MPAQKEILKDRLARHREIRITVIGRKSGRAITIPVWFVLDGDTLSLLPVQGSNTQWYKNVLHKPAMQIDAQGGAGIQVVPVTDAARVKAVVEKFRAKYGNGDVKKYYSKFDVAVIVPLR
jgi:hypothetical protein